MTRIRGPRAAALLAGIVLVAVGAVAAVLSPAQAAPVPVPPGDSFADSAFQHLWDRTDGPVAGHQAQRGWYWGPSPGRSLVEIYDEGPGHVHRVQYFDKSRMEINNPAGDPGSKWYVTNGLLSVELISGRIQFGGVRYINNPAGPANIPLASDIDDSTAPTYASFTNLANTPLGDHRAAARTGQPIIETVSRAGEVGTAQERAAYGVTYTMFAAETSHNIPSVFWDYFNARGPVRENGQMLDAALNQPWFFTSGYPISEAYWARVKLAGQPHDVLIQAYQRRVLTYIPDYAPAWQVQMGNIGLHYVQWRYPRGLPAPVPTIPAPAP